MGNIKLLYLLLTTIGIPAFFYAWFMDITSTFELWKAIVLGLIGAFTAIIIGVRQFIKLLKEWKEYRSK